MEHSSCVPLQWDQKFSPMKLIHCCLHCIEHGSYTVLSNSTHFSSQTWSIWWPHNVTNTERWSHTAQQTTPSRKCWAAGTHPLSRPVETAPNVNLAPRSCWLSKLWVMEGGGAMSYAYTQVTTSGRCIISGCVILLMDSRPLHNYYRQKRKSNEVRIE